jgi:cytochrome c553
MRRARIACLAALLAGLGASALAQSSAHTRQLAARVCATCHGAQGNSTRPEVPNLAGQGAAYLEEQLHLFAAQGGRRASGVMAAIALRLTPQEMSDLADYFSHQRLEPGHDDAAAPRVVEQGESIWFDGVASKNVPACASCHGVRAQGLATAFPRLAGQRADYVAAQLRQFRSGARASDPRALMRSLAARLSDDEMDAVAQYVAALR